MKAKPKKSRSASIVKGKVQDIHFTIGGDQIPTIKEQPVKSLGQLYAVQLTDRHRGVEIETKATEGLVLVLVSSSSSSLITGREQAITPVCPSFLWVQRGQLVLAYC